MNPMIVTFQNPSVNIQKSDMRWSVSLVLIIAICFGWSVPGIAVEKSMHQPEDSITSGSPWFLNHAADKETGQRLIQPLYPTTQNSPDCKLSKDETAEIKRKNETADYLNHSECLIVRFERFDIIHPFNYFW
jgi:hypothetical protein